MSESVKTGGPAFPLHDHGAQTLGMHLSGMTLRDYFAAEALQIAWKAYDAGYTGEPENVTESIAKHSYQIADAMLKAREQ